MSLMPCFDANQGRAEGIVIGRLLAGYGELEVSLCACHVAVEGIYEIPVKKLFGFRNAYDRIQFAIATLGPEYAKAGLEADLLQALDDLEWCRKVRNQYAHCQWYWTSKEGLCFLNLEELAKQHTHILALTAGRHSISLALLNAQEAFFWYVKQCLMHLETAYQQWDRARLRAPIPAGFLYPKPQVMARPAEHD